MVAPTTKVLKADREQRPTPRREELILEVTEALTQAMAAAGVTRAELARRLGSTRGHVSQLLAGGRNLTLGTIAEIADALGCTVELRVAAGGRRASLRSHHVEVPGEGGSRRPPRRPSLGARR
jgi:transcriptional regulator with XRE-family HTH domain